MKEPTAKHCIRRQHQEFDTLPFDATARLSERALTRRGDESSIADGSAPLATRQNETVTEE